MKKQIETALKFKLATNPKWAMRAIVKVYENQTDSERSAKVTTDANGIGFTGCDAEILSSFAEQIIKRGSLSPKQLAIAQRKAPRYWRQILPSVKAEAIEQLDVLGEQLIAKESAKAIEPSAPNYENSMIAMLAGN